MSELSHRSEKIYYQIQHHIPGGIWETLPYGKNFAKIKDAVDFLTEIERQEYFINYRILQVEECVAMTFDRNGYEGENRYFENITESSNPIKGSSNVFRYNSSTQLLNA